MISDAEIKELEELVSPTKEGAITFRPAEVIARLLERLRSAEEILIGAFEVADIRGESGTCPPDCECWLHQARAHFAAVKP